MQVKRMCGNALIERVHKLAQTANIQKGIGLHTLRHSIATHLLQSGMTLEEVSQFLGHSSLESTQIYTHLVNVEL
jgi:integrase/recombinase XerD